MGRVKIKQGKKGEEKVHTKVGRDDGAREVLSWKKVSSPIQTLVTHLSFRRS